MPVDKTFKGICEELAKDAPKYAKEYTDAIGYKADIATRAAACRGGTCVPEKVKITKGELRLGIYVDFDGEHTSTYYKHWVSHLIQPQFRSNNDVEVYVCVRPGTCKDVLRQRRI